MIRTGKQIYAALANDTEFVTLVGLNQRGKVKLFPLILPEDTVLPAVIYQRGFDNDPTTKDGQVISRSIFDFTIITLKYDEGVEIAQRISDVLDNKRTGTIIGMKLASGAENYTEGAFIQNLTFNVHAYPARPDIVLTVAPAELVPAFEASFRYTISDTTAVWELKADGVVKATGTKDSLTQNITVKGCTLEVTATTLAGNMIVDVSISDEVNFGNLDSTDFLLEAEIPGDTRTALCQVSL